MPPSLKAERSYPAQVITQKLTLLSEAYVCFGADASVTPASDPIDEVKPPKTRV